MAGRTYSNKGGTRVPLTEKNLGLGPHAPKRAPLERGAKRAPLERGAKRAPLERGAKRAPLRMRKK